MPAEPIQIIGGGLAGLTLGILLRRAQVPVTVWEASGYPRHRVCGEFISGRGQGVLATLGLEDEFRRAGAVEARTARFFTPLGQPPAHLLPVPALALSRFTMDALLAKQFEELGGDLRAHQPHTGSVGLSGIVHCTGRRLHPPSSEPRWFGLKVHARNVELTADLEMHVSPDAYIGLCRLNRDVVNICGLFRRRPVRLTAGTSPCELLRGRPGTILDERLRSAVFEPGSFCSVAGFSLALERAATQLECRLGDALTMIPPVTGNGMSMAFEAAQIAASPLLAYSRGEMSWPDARQAVALACDRTFAPRLAWAAWLQRILFAPCFQDSLHSLAFRSEALWRALFTRTR